MLIDYDILKLMLLGIDKRPYEIPRTEWKDD